MTTVSLTRLEKDVAEYLQLTPSQAVALCDELSAYGINTFEEFEDVHFYSTDSYRPDEEFAQFLSEEINCDEIPSHIQGCIDWETVWNSHYRFDFWSHNDGETTHYFFNS